MNRMVAFKLAEFLTNKATEIQDDWGIEFDESLVGGGEEYAMSGEDLGEMDAFMHQIAEKVVELAETLV